MKTLRVVHNKKVNEIAVLFHNEIAFTADLADIDKGMKPLERSTRTCLYRSSLFF